MNVDKNFNKRGAVLVQTTEPCVSSGGGDALGVCATIFALPNMHDAGALRLHMTPGEALRFGLSLVTAAHDQLRNTGVHLK